ncbi:hypothetical protein LOTGIDRAFT_235302 [Lottia gigantea]|uniref:Bcl-2 Bcl-2 homology region 1-3 domain-containing protein n=1 Tax=Lottia gigantea TaxID=225164 RepID=V3ZQS5_LOTGI|nr:hypothetical protein LOTGIDRAFT_235302 [Lottia gigantea]ESO86707.1 hypothetical protein LOTGIDRAFT_235302 [Lottia gigantea]
MASVVMPQSFCTKRRNSQTLAPLIMPPRDVQFPSDYDDVAEEGKMLFNRFVLFRMEQEQVEDNKQQAAISDETYIDPMWIKAGRELRIMADEFARTRSREEIGVENITYEQFKELLSELFSQGHITKERVMMLFFFCSDVAVRTVSCSVEMCKRFMHWSLTFITQCVCRWVRENGGWEDVLVVDRMPTLRPVLAAGAVCCVVYFAVKYYKS